MTKDNDNDVYAGYFDMLDFKEMKESLDNNKFKVWDEDIEIEKELHKYDLLQDIYRDFFMKFLKSFLSSFMKDKSYETINQPQEFSIQFIKSYESYDEEPFPIYRKEKYFLNIRSDKSGCDYFYPDGDKEKLDIYKNDTLINYIISTLSFYGFEVNENDWEDKYDSFYASRREQLRNYRYSKKEKNVVFTGTLSQLFKMYFLENERFEYEYYDPNRKKSVQEETLSLLKSKIKELRKNVKTVKNLKKVIDFSCKKGLLDKKTMEYYQESIKDLEGFSKKL